MSTNDSSKFFNRMLINGICGASAVSVQTFTLMWVHTLIQEHKKTGLQFFTLAKRLYQKGGLRRFYQGAASSWVTASLARFGDTATNFSILNYFQKSSSLSSTPLFIQSAITWMIASTWRLALMPLALVKTGNLNAQSTKSKQVKSISWLARIHRIYRKQTRGDILSLYSWFATQNYLDHYLPSSTFEQNKNRALLRYSFIGFCSMISLDVCLNIYRKFLEGRKNLKNDTKNILLGQGRNRMLMKGFHGIIFCVSSHYIKQQFFQEELV